MAVRGSREIVIDAPPEAILDVLADIDGVPKWSPLHKHVEVLDTYDDGRPRHVRATLRILGLTDEETLEYHWGPDWVLWDAEANFRQHGQHVEYTLRPEGGKTRVRFDVTVEIALPVPKFLVKRAREIVLDTGTEGLRERVMGQV